MKIWAISLGLLFFLCGCDASSEIERGMALRSAVLQGNSCSFEGRVTADYGDRMHMFSMKCSFDTAGRMEFCVTEPESISNITGNISADRGALTFNDTVLYFPLLADEQLAPVSAPWIFMKTLRSGYLTAACMEDGKLRLTIDDSYEEDALKLDIWLNDAEKPVLCEILYDGRRILSMEIVNFVIV